MTFVDRLTRFLDSKPLARASDLSVAQRNFLELHALHLVDRWQWYFMEAQLRAHAGRHTATIWRDELNNLVERGLMFKGQGAADVHLTDAGREMICAVSKT